MTSVAMVAGLTKGDACTRTGEKNGTVKNTNC